MIWLTALGWLRSAFRALLGLVVRWPWQMACVGLLAAFYWAFTGWTHERADYAAYRHQAAASVLHLEQEKAATEARQAQITKDADHATQPARDHALDAARRYAAAHRCMSPAAVAAAGPASAGLPEPAATPEGIDGPPETTAVVVPQWGVDNCSLNSSDLNTAVEWAKKTWGEKK